MTCRKAPAASSTVRNACSTKATGSRPTPVPEADTLEAKRQLIERPDPAPLQPHRAWPEHPRHPPQRSPPELRAEAETEPSPQAGQGRHAGRRPVQPGGRHLPQAGRTAGLRHRNPQRQPADARMRQMPARGHGLGRLRAAPLRRRRHRRAVGRTLQAPSRSRSRISTKAATSRSASRCATSTASRRNHDRHLRAACPAFADIDAPRARPGLQGSQDQDRNPAYRPRHLRRLGQHGHRRRAPVRHWPCAAPATGV
jgi:hypothetical protein